MTRRTLAAALALALTVSPGLAHRLDEYAQVAAISVTVATVTIDLRLTPGQLVAEDVLVLIDTDMDGQVSPEEQGAYLDAVIGDLTLTVDGRVQAQEITSYSFPDEPSIRDGLGIIAITLETPIEGVGTHHLSLVNEHMRNISVYLSNALVPHDATITIGAQNRSPDQSTYELNWSAVEFVAE